MSYNQTLAFLSNLNFHLKYGIINIGKLSFKDNIFTKTSILFNISLTAI